MVFAIFDNYSCRSCGTLVGLSASLCFPTDLLTLFTPVYALVTLCSDSVGWNRSSLALISELQGRKAKTDGILLALDLAPTGYLHQDI